MLNLQILRKLITIAVGTFCSGETLRIVNFEKGVHPYFEQRWLKLELSEQILV
jgi:hypothetical protein